MPARRLRKQDKTIERIRKVRHEISKKFGHNPRKLLEHYIKMQERHKPRAFDGPQ